MNLKNELPVAVHIASGGDARVRRGGQVISFNETTAGSFQVSNATHYKLQFSLRSSSGLMLILGYTSPLTLANASAVLEDIDIFEDDVLEDTTVYMMLVPTDSEMLIAGGALDRAYVSFYG